MIDYGHSFGGNVGFGGYTGRGANVGAGGYTGGGAFGGGSVRAPGESGMVDPYGLRISNPWAEQGSPGQGGMLGYVQTAVRNMLGGDLERVRAQGRGATFQAASIANSMNGGNALDLIGKPLSGFLGGFNISGNNEEIMRKGGIWNQIPQMFRDWMQRQDAKYAGMGPQPMIATGSKMGIGAGGTGAFGGFGAGAEEPADNRTSWRRMIDEKYGPVMKGMERPMNQPWLQVPEGQAAPPVVTGAGGNSSLVGNGARSITEWTPQEKQFARRMPDGSWRLGIQMTEPPRPGVQEFPNHAGQVPYVNSPSNYRGVDENMPLRGRFDSRFDMQYSPDGIRPYMGEQPPRATDRYGWHEPLYGDDTGSPGKLGGFQRGRFDMTGARDGVPVGTSQYQPVRSGDYTGNIRGQSAYAPAFLPPDATDYGVPIADPRIKYRNIHGEQPNARGYDRQPLNVPQATPEQIAADDEWMEHNAVWGAPTDPREKARWQNVNRKYGEQAMRELAKEQLFAQMFAQNPGIGWTSDPYWYTQLPFGGSLTYSLMPFLGGAW